MNYTNDCRKTPPDKLVMNYQTQNSKRYPNQDLNFLVSCAKGRDYVFAFEKAWEPPTTAEDALDLANVRIVVAPDLATHDRRTKKCTCGLEMVR